MVYCAKCGNELQEQAGYCSNCGAPADPNKPLEEERRVAPRAGLARSEVLILWIVGGVIALGVVLALAAAIVPQVVRFTPSDQVSQAAASELANVQVAMDTLMAENGLATVDAQGTPSKSWTRLPTSSGTVRALSPNFLRDGTTAWGYCWDSSGLVRQTAEKNSTTC